MSTKITDLAIEVDPADVKVHGLNVQFPYIQFGGVLSLYPTNDDATVVEQLEALGSIGYAIAAQCERLAEQRAAEQRAQDEADYQQLTIDEPGMTADEVERSPFHTLVELDDRHALAEAQAQVDHDDQAFAA